MTCFRFKFTFTLCVMQLYVIREKSITDCQLYDSTMKTFVCVKQTQNENAYTIFQYLNIPFLFPCDLNHKISRRGNRISGNAK